MVEKIPSKNDINDVCNRISGYIHETPVFTSNSLNRITGCSLFFKCENFQKIGAFKARGALNAVLSLKDDELKRGVATHSSGNHAQALAYAASVVNTKAYIVMPSTAPAVKVAGVKEYGGEIIFCEPTLEARERELNRLVGRTGAHFIHPYNNYDVIAGQATCAWEIFSNISELDYVIVPVGGGGLLSGTCLSRNYFSPETTVMAGEPAGAQDAFLSLQKGEIVPSINPVTIADGLLTSLGTKTFPIIQSNVKEIILVEEHEIVEAMKLIWQRMKIVVEPSAAVPLAVVLNRKAQFNKNRIALILSGGNVDFNHLPF